MRVRHNLNSALGSVGDIHAGWHAELTHAEIAQAGDDELLAHDDVECAARVVANCQVHGDVGLLVAHGELDWAAADGEVCAL